MADTAANTRAPYRLSDSPGRFFAGFAATGLYGAAAKYFQGQMHVGSLGLGLLVAAPRLLVSLTRIFLGIFAFGAFVAPAPWPPRHLIGFYETAGVPMSTVVPTDMDTLS